MKIELQPITIREIVESYQDLWEWWVFGYDGKLNIRPPYQREFVYKDKQRDEVIRTIQKSFPLNVIYWIKNEDGTFEVLDWQQRTISFCQYVSGDFSIDGLAFHNLTDDKQKQIFDYQLQVYICEWTNSEKLDWFKIINIAWEKLYDQELRNAVYTWSWLSSAKLIFSKTNCPAYLLAKEYINGSPIRQDFLETAIDWINDWEIEDYMSRHQHDDNADELWSYFQKVISWIKITFPNYRKEMKGVNRWKLYNQFKDKELNTTDIENEISKLMQDEDVTKKAWIREYILTRDEKYLSIRAFTDNTKREVYEKQKGICTKCEEHFEINEMEADHITPRSQWWKTNTDNCQMLCKNCNRRKSNI